MRRYPNHRPGMIFVALTIFAGGADAASSEDLQAPLLYGVKNGHVAPMACYIRRYDAAHMASHPHQNVRAMRLYARRLGDDESASNELQIGLYFRGLAKRWDIVGSCHDVADHPGALQCSIDCDGGPFGLRQTTADTLLVDIPAGVQASIYDPEGGRQSPDIGSKAIFGSDDRTFRLERTALRDCAAMVGDGPLVGSMKPVK